MSQPPYPPPAPHGRPDYRPSSPQRRPQPRHGQQPYPPAPPHGHVPNAATGQRYVGPPAQRPPAPQPPAPRPPAAHTPAPPPAPKQRRRWPWIVGAVANGGGTSAPPAPSSTGAPALAQNAPAAPAESTSGVDVITYEVTGDGVSKANNITYVKDSNFGMQQENGAKLPWSKDVEMESGLFDVQPMTLTAQSGSGGSGTITCRILRNGEEVTSSTSSGPYAVVTCSGGLG
jgi:Mycobacterium membrane protein